MLEDMIPWISPCSMNTWSISTDYGILRGGGGFLCSTPTFVFADILVNVMREEDSASLLRSGVLDGVPHTTLNHGADEGPGLPLPPPNTLLFAGNDAVYWWHYHKWVSHGSLAPIGSYCSWVAFRCHRCDRPLSLSAEWILKLLLKNTLLY